MTMPTDWNPDNADYERMPWMDDDQDEDSRDPDEDPRPDPADYGFSDGY